jgi:hypothetical protein
MTPSLVMASLINKVAGGNEITFACDFNNTRATPIFA